MSDEFREPVTADETRDRLAATNIKIQSLQRALTESRITVSGSKGSPEWHARRKRMTTKLGHLSTETARLKKWLRSFRLCHQTALVAGETSSSLVGKTRDALFGLADYTIGLEREVAELRAENARLHEELVRIKDVVAPGRDVDEWREP